MTKTILYLLPDKNGPESSRYYWNTVKLFGGSNIMSITDISISQIPASFVVVVQTKSKQASAGIYSCSYMLSKLFTKVEYASNDLVLK